MITVRGAIVVCKPAVSSSVQILCPIPLPPSRREGENFSFYFARRLRPLHPAAGLNVLLTTTKFAEISHLPMHFKEKHLFIW